jgi:transcriptional regulator GlxA family with amidase domain
MDTKRIGIIGFDGVAAINLVGPLEAFANAFYRDEEGNERPCYRVSTIACTGTFVTNTGLTFHASIPEAGGEVFDTLVVPGGTGLLSDATCNEVAGLINSHAPHARRIASICTGVYALAATGLLKGRRVTTHWEHAGKVVERFPELRVEESALFLKDDKFYSSAGATAGIDLALALISEDFGQQVALRVARRLLVYLVRDGGQEQYSEPLSFAASDKEGRARTNGDRMQKLVQWIGRHLGDDLRLENLAKRALMTKSDFVAQFTGTFGVPPGLFVKNLRFNEARRRLARGEKGPDVASALGFDAPEYFIQEFRRRFGALPSDYQRRFGAMEPASTS